MQPHHRALNVEQSPQQSISFPQIDSSHTGPPSAVVASIIRFDGLDPKVPEALVAFLPKTNVD